MFRPAALAALALLPGFALAQSPTLAPRGVVPAPSGLVLVPGDSVTVMHNGVATKTLLPSLGAFLGAAPPLASNAVPGLMRGDGSTLTVDPLTGIASVVGQAPTPVSTTPTLAGLQVLLANGQYVTGTALQALLGVSTQTTPTPTPTAAYTPGAHALLATASSTGEATTPGTAAMTPSTLLDMRAFINTPSYAAPDAVGTLMSHWDGGYGAILYLDPSGIPGMVFNYSGGFENLKATTAIPVAVNTNVVVRGVVNFTNAGSGGVPGATLQFFTSIDGEASYQQVGSNISTSGPGTVPAPASGTPLTIGSNASGNLPPAGLKFQRSRLLVDGTSVVDVDFSNASAGASTVTASTGQVFTVVSPGAIQ